MIEAIRNSANYLTFSKPPNPTLVISYRRWATLLEEFWGWGDSRGRTCDPGGAYTGDE